MNDLDRVFLPEVREAHYKGYGEMFVLCGLETDESWWGTGSWAESDVASRLPVCDDCQDKARERERLHLARLAGNVAPAYAEVEDDDWPEEA